MQVSLILASFSEPIIVIIIIIIFVVVLNIIIVELIVMVIVIINYNTCATSQKGGVFPQVKQMRPCL